MFGRISEGVKQIGQHMIDNPSEWVQEVYHFRNKKNPDIALWTANGASFIQIDGNKGFNFSERTYLNKCIKKSIANRLKAEQE